MRPIKLTMQAFGSYGKPETIDFTELGDQRLFLIHGPTGSGKSTVLDAICFALYGVATGEDRDAKSFRSDFASPLEITEVSLEFAIGARLFRILRQPEQARAKKRGQGMTRSPVSATMWERTDCVDDEEGTVLASRWSEVTKKVEELLGFRSEQFRQVIVLPQGRFRDLLMASSNEREEILQQLFDTSFYKKIQVSLKEQAKRVGGEIKDQRTRRSVMLEQCDCEDEGELAELLAELDKDLESQEKAAEEAGTKAKTAHTALNEATGLEKRFLLRDQIIETVAGFEKQSTTIDEDRKRLELAQQADALSDFFAAIKHARKAKADAEQALVTSQDTLNRISQVKDRAREELQAQKDKEDQRKSLEREVTELERIRPVIAGLAKERAGRDALKDELETQDKALKKLHGKGKEQQANRDRLNAEIASLKGKLRDRELLEGHLKAAEKRLETSAILAQKGEEAAAAEELLENCTAEVKKLDKQLRNYRKHLQQLIAQREAGSAAMLAKDLEPGEACPVCGSTDHPRLAASDEEVPGNDAIDDARQTVDAAEKALDVENRRAVQAGTTYAMLQGELAALKQSASDLNEKSEALEAEVVQARKTLDEHDQLSASLEKRLSEFDGLDKDRSENAAAIEDLQKSHGELSKRLIAAEAALQEKAKTIGKDFENEAAVDAGLSKAKQSLVESRAALDAAIENERKASNETVKAETALEHAQQVSKSKGEEAESKDKEWQARLKKARFESEEAFSAAELPEEARNELTSNIEAYDTGYGEAKVRARDISAELEGTQRPDLEVLTKTANELEAVRSEKAQTVVAIREKVKTLTAIQDQLKQLSKKLTTLDERYGVLGTLANAADGQNSLRVSLQRFVLATRLDDVLVAASQRMSIMSKGRFRIQRNTTADDKRAAGGLELEVEDAYTGSSRPVSTLSGGESFQAALSLALGLSEVVQAYAGGIRLDTIFVDEGFGSLDTEALELAINTLIDLQATGRLVGVISHVPELKERIDVRLQVESGKSGSTASFQLP